MSRLIAVVILITGCLVALQIDVLSHIRLFGVVVMVVWLWPFCLGLLGAGQVAVVAGVISGLCFDAHAATTFGLNAAVGAAVAAVGLRLERQGVGDIDGAAWWTAPALSALTGVAAPLLFILAGAFTLDFSLWRGSLVLTMVVNAAAFAVLARPLLLASRTLTGLAPVRR